MKRIAEWKRGRDARRSSGRKPFERERESGERREDERREANEHELEGTRADESEPASVVKPRSSDPDSDGNKLSNRLTFLWIALLVALLLRFGALGAGAVQTIPYSKFKAHLARGEVVSVLVGDSEISGQLRLAASAEGEGSKSASSDAKGGADLASTEERLSSADGIPPREFAPADDAGAEQGAQPDAHALSTDTRAKVGESLPTREVPFRTNRIEDPELIGALEAADVEYSALSTSPIATFLTSWFFPFALTLALMVWLFRSVGRRAGGQMMGFGKSRARLVAEEGTGVGFDDVAGCDEAKQELRQMVDFLRNPSRFTALGGRIPKGVLLLGPPGTGKTLLARAVAGEAGVPFFSLSGSDFVEMFVGVGAARVRDLFEQAKSRAPCIVFIDEVDAIGRQRGVSMGVVNDEREQTLNQLLSEMDGFENNSGVILLAATNRPEILDKALLRPGRFDRQVVLDAPDLIGHEAILRVHVRGKPLAPDVDLAKIARVTPGMSGADLANVVNEAALLAADRGANVITAADLLEAVEKVVAGPERRSRRLEPDEKRRVAIHESGHALVAARVTHAEPVQKITIVPRGRAALGYTMQLPDQEHYLRTRDELLDRLVVLLGGRAAEELVIGSASTGAVDDLRTATDLARQVVCLFGMSDRLGLAHCATPSEGRYLGGEGTMIRDCSEETSREIDEEVRTLLDRAHERAKKVLDTERPTLDRITEALLEHESLDRASFERIVGSSDP